MRIFGIVVAIACILLSACVCQREALPAAMRSELIRIGGVVTDETQRIEARKECLMRYCKILTEAIEMYGSNAVSRRTIVESLRLDDNSDDITHVYSISNGDGSFCMLFIDYCLRDALFVRRVAISVEARM
jgi:hypothetical protein